MKSIFSKKLINEYKAYVKKRHGVDIADEEAEEHLDRLASYFAKVEAIMAGFREKDQ